MFKKILISFFTLFTSAVSLGVESSFPVVCKNKDNCPSGVALISVDNFACTGFLIKKNVLVTNRHCIPDSMTNKSASCASLTAYFPKTQYTAEWKSTCSKITKMGPELLFQITPDFAVIELKDSAPFNAFSVSNLGILDKQSVYIYKVNPKSTPTELEVINCTNVLNSHLNPLAKSSDSIVFSFLPCAVVQGNSGSPVVDQSGNVVAILNARSDLNLGKMIPYLKKENIEAGFATNIKCIKEDPEPECLKFNSENDFQESIAELTLLKTSGLKKSAETETKLSIEDLFMKSNRLYRWNFEPQKATDIERKNGFLGTHSFRPSCININKESILKAAKTLKKAPMLMKFRTYRLEFIAKFNDFLQLEPELKKVNEELQVELIPKDLLKDKIDVRWKLIGKIQDEDSVYETRTLEHCP